MFITGYKDYLLHPTTAQQRDMVQHAIQGASAMMLNTPGVWEHYDDVSGDRQLLTAMAHWPHFQAFMRARDEEVMSREAIDPKDFDFTTV